MTRFQLFINELTRCALNYCSKVGCDVKDKDYVLFNSNNLSTNDVEAYFTKWIKQFSDLGSSRSDLIQYLVKAICHWRDSTEDINKFKKKQDGLVDEISGFIESLNKLFEIKNGSTLEVNSPFGKQELLSLQPWYSKPSRGNQVVTQFLMTVAPMCSKKEFCTSMIKEFCTSMIEEHVEYFNKLSKVYELSEAQKEIERLKQEIKELKAQSALEVNKSKPDEKTKSSPSVESDKSEEKDSDEPGAPQSIGSLRGLFAVGALAAAPQDSLYGKSTTSLNIGQWLNGGQRF